MIPLSRLVLLSVLVAVAGSAPVAAQTRASARGERPSALVLAETATPAADRTLGKARMYCLAGTLAPVGAGLGLMVNNASDNAVLAGALLVLAGGVVGPSAGHIYLGDGRRAWIGVGLRTAGVGAGFLVGALAAQNDTSDSFAAGVTEFMVVSGAALVAGSAYSFATLDDSARERGFVVAPAVGAGGQPVLAVAVRL